MADCRILDNMSLSQGRSLDEIRAMIQSQKIPSLDRS
jgi:hypothetical protein